MIWCNYAVGQIRGKHIFAESSEMIEWMESCKHIIYEFFILVLAYWAILLGFIVIFEPPAAAAVLLMVELILRQVDVLIILAG